jgi:linoleoyl-CoA desaturase
MKDRHTSNEADSRLLRLIHEEVQKKLNTGNLFSKLLLVFKCCFYTCLVIASYYFIFKATQPVTLVCSFICFGLSSILLGFNFAHDFSHNAVFKNRALNNFFYTVIYTMVGAHAAAWKHRHIHSHHYAPNVHEYDSDLQITSLIRVEPGSTYKWFHKYQVWYAPMAYSGYSLYWVFIKDFVIFSRDDEYPAKKTLYYMLSFVIQKAVYISGMIILPVVFAVQPWYWILAAFVMMHLIQSLFLLFTFFITHHVENTAYFSTDEGGYINTSWINNQVKSSNDFYPFSEFANFIFGGFNNHIAHHLFPHINHVHYPELNRVLYKILNRHGIEPNVTGFFSGVVSHMKHLKKMGSKSRGNK